MGREQPQKFRPSIAAQPWGQDTSKKGELFLAREGFEIVFFLFFKTNSIFERMTSFGNTPRFGGGAAVEPGRIETKR